MPDEKDKVAHEQPERREPSPATRAEPRRAEAVAEMMNAAAALEELRRQAAVEAMRLPDKRLDDAGPNGAHVGYYLSDDGRKINAWGQEVTASGRVKDD